MKILDLTEEPPVEEPSDPAQPLPPPPANEPKRKLGHHDGDDGDDSLPFDFILNETSGIQINQNGKATYVAAGVEVDRETYLACVATCGVQGAEVMALIETISAAARVEMERIKSNR